MRAVAMIACCGLFLTGCASMTEYGYGLTPKPSACQVNVVNSGFLVAGANTVCWDNDGRVIHTSAFQGTSPAQVTMGAVGAAAAVAGPVGGALILGNDIIKAAKTLDGATLNTVTSGSVNATGSITTSGTVTGTVNGVLSVPPITGQITVPPVTGNLGITLPPGIMP